MLNALIAALRIVFGNLWVGARTALGLYLTKLVGSVLVVGFGAVFKDTVLDGVGHLMNKTSAVLSGLGFSLPTVADGLNALPYEMLVVMKRIGVDQCLAVIITAAGVRVIGSLFSWFRAFKILGAAGS